MGNKCLSPVNDPVFSDRKNSLDTVSSHFQEKFVVRNISMDSVKDLDEEKIRVRKSSIVLIIGDNRIKVATAICIVNTAAGSDHKVEIIVATRDPDAAKNALLARAGVRLIKADMNSPETLLPAIRDSGADTVLLVPPNRSNRSAQTISGISACRRAGVGHLVVLSSTCVERDAPSIFGDQCKLIEAFIKTCKISYTIVRIPILMDNYLSQLQSMAEYGIFYRPIPPNSKRNAITGQSSDVILLTYPLFTILRSLLIPRAYPFISAVCVLCLFLIYISSACLLCPPQCPTSALPSDPSCCRPGHTATGPFPSTGH